MTDCPDEECGPCEPYQDGGYDDAYYDGYSDYYDYDAAANDVYTDDAADNAAGAGALSGATGNENVMETMEESAVLDLMAQTVQQFAERFALPNTAAAAAVLNDMGWPIEPDEVFLTHREDCVKHAHLKEEAVLATAHTIISNDTLLDGGCMVCYDDIEPGQGLAFSTCRHFAHRECWQQYLRARVQEWSVYVTPCMMCAELVNLKDIPELCAGADEGLLYTLTHAYLTEYTFAHPHFSLCPTSDCKGVVHILRPLAEGATLHCDLCHHEWCRTCGDLPHHPASCAALAEWRAGNVEEGATLALINRVTKLCPKCRRPIEKNSGCNHMTCSLPCRYEFCWICMGDWKAHSSGSAYTCTRPTAPTVTNTVKEQKETLLRSYYESITSHKRSSQLEQKAIREFLMQTLNNYTTVYEPVLRHLEASLKKARDLIANCHISAYVRKLHMIEKGQEGAFDSVTPTEFRCGRIEGATEELSRLLDLCVGTPRVPGVLRDADVDPAAADPLLHELKQQIRLLDSWCDNVESDVA